MEVGVGVAVGAGALWCAGRREHPPFSGVPVLVSFFTSLPFLLFDLYPAEVISTEEHVLSVSVLFWCRFVLHIGAGFYLPF